MQAHDFPFARAVAPGANQAPASNTDAVVSLEAVAGKSHIISQVRFSYSAEPTSPFLKIEWNSSEELYHIYPTQGTQVIMFHPPLAFPENTQVTVTLSAGGDGVSGTIYVTSWNQKENYTG